VSRQRRRRNTCPGWGERKVKGRVLLGTVMTEKTKRVEKGKVPLFENRQSKLHRGEITKRFRGGKEGRFPSKEGAEGMKTTQKKRKKKFVASNPTKSGGIADQSAESPSGLKGLARRKKGERLTIREETEEE